MSQSQLIQEMQSGSTRVYRPNGHSIVDDIRNVFEINEKTVLLGQGVSGKVYKTCLKSNVCSSNSNICPNTYYALKCMNKSVPWIEKSFLRESHNMMALVKIPGTIDIVGTFEDSNYLCILSELAGSDAFSMVKKSAFGRLEEHYVKYCIYEILKSVFYLHSMNYVHRDIKPENIVLTQTVREERRECHIGNGMNGDECNGTQVITNLEITQPKLIDLADCGSIDDKAVYNKLVGTMCYLAPERLRAHYGYELKKADVWAVGVSCYEMLSGKRCFFGVNNDQLFGRIKKGVWVWPQGLNISENAKNFVSTLLEPNCNQRPCAAEALLHPWFSDILTYEMNSKTSFESRNDYIKHNPLINQTVDIVECEQHFSCQSASSPQMAVSGSATVPGVSMFTMQLPNLCMPSSNSNVSISTGNGNMNSVGNVANNSNVNCHSASQSNNPNHVSSDNQISPSASTFSHGRSCSPAFTAETGGYDTPRMPNIGFVMQSQQQTQGQSYFNLASQQAQSVRNQIPKFVPTQHVQYNAKQHCQSPQSVQSMHSVQSPSMRMQMQAANTINNNNGMRFAFV